VGEWGSGGENRTTEQRIKNREYRMGVEEWGVGCGGEMGFPAGWEKPGQPRDRWEVLATSTAQGPEVHLVRFSGREPDTELSRSFLVRGASGAGAWGGDPDEPRALVAYHEPSRTEVWGMIIDSEARVLVKPFALATAEEDHLFCNHQGKGTMEVTWEDERWQVTCGSHSPAAREGEPDLVQRVGVNLTGDVSDALAE